MYASRDGVQHYLKVQYVTFTCVCSVWHPVEYGVNLGWLGHVEALNQI